MVRSLYTCSKSIMFFVFKKNFDYLIILFVQRIAFSELNRLFSPMYTHLRILPRILPIPRIVSRTLLRIVPTFRLLHCIIFWQFKNV